MFTVEQIREDIAPYVLDAGKCSDSTYVLKYINQARRLLWPRGPWKGLVDDLIVRAYCGLLTLPYDYLRAMDAQLCASKRLEKHVPKTTAIQLTPEINEVTVTYYTVNPYGGQDPLLGADSPILQGVTITDVGWNSPDDLDVIFYLLWQPPNEPPLVSVYENTGNVFGGTLLVSGQLVDPPPILSVGSNALNVKGVPLTLNIPEEFAGYDGYFRLQRDYTPATSIVLNVENPDTEYTIVIPGCPSSFVNIDTPWYELAPNIRFDNSCWGEMIDLGDKFATFSDYKFGNHRLFLKGEHPDDEDQIIKINAIGEHGDRKLILGRVGDDHEFISLDPWIKYFRHVSKQQTKGRILIYIYDPNRGNTQHCATYEPDDLAPQYRRYRVSGRGNCGSFYFLRAKRRYRPLLNETDPVEFPEDALIQACIAITARRNRQPGEFTAALNLAVEALNQELKDSKQESGGRIRMSAQNKNTNLVEY